MPKQAKKERWVPHDDERLLEMIERGKSWDEIAEYFPGRTKQALLERYRKLRTTPPGPWTPPAPNRVKGPNYTPEEDELLLKLKERGESWIDIAKSFPGRSKRGLQYRYYALQRERRENGQ